MLSILALWLTCDPGASLAAGCSHADSAAAIQQQEEQPPAEGDRPAPQDDDEIPEGFERSGHGVLRQVDRSFFAYPLYLGEQPPGTVAARHLQFVFTGCLGAPREFERTQEEALELATHFREQLLAGADFERISLEYSDSNRAQSGGVLGTVTRGVLYESLESYLWSAEIGALSEPIVTPTGIHLVQRIDQWAGARLIRIDGQTEDSLAVVQDLLSQLNSGADFQALAREHSTDPYTKLRGGDLAAFERGPSDSLVKAAAFKAGMGEVVGPIRGPKHLYLVQRVAPDLIAPELHEQTWIQVRGLFLTHDQAGMSLPPVGRNAIETEQLAESLAASIRDGEDMGGLAAEYNDDPMNGRGRRGMVGWVHRHQPQLPNFVRPMFNIPVGELVGPLPSDAGWVILRREG